MNAAVSHAPATETVEEVPAGAREIVSSRSQPANAGIAAELRTYMVLLPTATPSERKKASDEVLTILFPHFYNWAPQLCRVHGDVYGGHREDMIGVIAERVIHKLNEVTAEKPHDNVSNWYSYLYATARYAALAYFQSTAVTAASGMTTVMRRQRHVAATRSRLRSTLGREPGDQEIIEAANTDMLARRSNAAKQGMLVSADDLAPMQPSLDIDDHAGGLLVDEDEALIAPVEGRNLIDLVIQECKNVSDELGLAAYLWLGRMYDEPPYLGVPQDVATELNMTAARASRLIAQARETAQQLCKDKFGINFPGV